jgi:hypothetical protein
MQAITTPTSSRSRGDWGLKRSLPLRTTTRTSTPSVRVAAIDTIENVTDFDSAADHTQNLAKWQEFNLAISNQARTKKDITSQRSAFDDLLDNTWIEIEPNHIAEDALKDASITAAPNTLSSNGDTGKVNNSLEERRNQIRLEKKSRWKYNGPPIDYIAHDEFERYISSILKDRKEEFQEYLRKRIRARHIKDAKTLARDEGVSAEFSVTKVEPTEEDYANRIKSLRDDFLKRDDVLRREKDSKLQDMIPELQDMIRDFLDLPPIAKLSSTDAVATNIAKFGDFSYHDEGSSARFTHPSAGLSYQRTNAYIENHPVLGPLARHTPVEARVVRPRQMVGKQDSLAQVGVGGFVAEEPSGLRYQQGKYTVNDGIARFSPDMEEGKKIWVEPRNAYVGPNGRVTLELTTNDLQTHVTIAKGEVPTPPASSPFPGMKRSKIQGFSQQEVKSAASSQNFMNDMFDLLSKQGGKST